MLSQRIEELEKKNNKKVVIISGEGLQAYRGPAEDHKTPKDILEDIVNKLSDGKITILGEKIPRVYWIGPKMLAEFIDWGEDSVMRKVSVLQPVTFTPMARSDLRSEGSWGAIHQPPEQV